MTSAPGPSCYLLGTHHIISITQQELPTYSLDKVTLGTWANPEMREIIQQSQQPAGIYVERACWSCTYHWTIRYEGSL